MLRVFRKEVAAPVLSVAVLVFSAASFRAQAPGAPPSAAPAAQQPGAPGAAAQPARRPMPEPVNLKVLPKGTPAADVIKIMRQFEGDLGVGCEYCHAQDPATHRNNFASDANPMKETARYMMRMTADINDKYIANLPSRMTADPVTCGTCHRGEKHPSVFEPKPRERPAAPPAAGVAPAAPPKTN